MVQARKPTRTRRSAGRDAKGTAKSGSIWDTPRVKKMLAQPVGSPVDLTREEMEAIFRDMIRNPRPYNRKKDQSDMRELRKIRKMWGSVARDA